jgi:DNA polymerase III epsilon subunit-like protein
MIYELNMTDETYRLVKTYDKTIIPDGFVIRNAHIHNITQQYAESHGVPFCDAIFDMLEDLSKIDILVSHNMDFDKPILLSELYRYELGEIIRHINRAKHFCTMKQCTSVTKKGNPPYKWPKLCELHDHLFNEKSVTAHNALADTNVLAKCFWQMYDLDILSITAEGVRCNE